MKSGRIVGTTTMEKNKYSIFSIKNVLAKKKNTVLVKENNKYKIDNLKKDIKKKIDELSVEELKAIAKMLDIDVEKDDEER